MATTITANGINFPDGSAGSPSIGGTDTNTGLFTGSDIVGFATGGSERLRIDASGNINIANDSGKLQLGTGADLKLYHDGSESTILSATGGLVIKDTGGYMRIRSDELKIQSESNETYIEADADGAVQLFHNNSKMIETDANGVKVGDGLRYIVGDDADGYLRYISNTVEIYVAHAQPFKINLGSETALLATANGSVELYHNNSKKIETTSGGVEVFGELQMDDANSHIKIPDNARIDIGTGNDLRLYHDGSNSYINDNGTGDLRVTSNVFKVNNAANDETMAIFTENGGVDLYYNDSKKFETTAAGTTTSGSMIVDGDIDPYSNNNNDLGSSANRWRNVYTNDLNLSNEGSSNDVDGTWGSYTIQEGAEDLFLVNKRNGKKYKFNLTEVS